MASTRPRRQHEVAKRWSPTEADTFAASGPMRSKVAPGASLSDGVLQERRPGHRII